jgi:hypothetical protein
MTTFQIVAPNKTTMFIIYNNKTNKIAIESVSSEAPEAQPHIYTINIDDFIEISKTPNGWWVWINVECMDAYFRPVCK